MVYQKMAVFLYVTNIILALSEHPLYILFIVKSQQQTVNLFSLEALLIIISRAIHFSNHCLRVKFYSIKWILLSPDNLSNYEREKSAQKNHKTKRNNQGFRSHCFSNHSPVDTPVGSLQRCQQTGKDKRNTSVPKHRPANIPPQSQTNIRLGIRGPEKEKCMLKILSYDFSFHACDQGLSPDKLLIRSVDVVL